MVAATTTRRNETSQEASLQFPWDAIVEYLEPLDLLACLSVNRQCRRAAGHELNHRAPTPTTVVQRSMFAAWLQAPNMGCRHSHCGGAQTNNHNNHKWRRPRRQTYSRLSGPFREGVIRELERNTEGIQNRHLFLLDYKRTYESEQSVLAVVDHEGRLVAIYKFSSVQYYESHLDQEVLESTRRCGLCRVCLENSGGFHPELSQIANAWTFDKPQMEWDWVHGFYGSVSSPNYGLIQLFHHHPTLQHPTLRIPQLSPTEIAALLMHALSSDARSIFGYVKAVYEDFDSEFYCFIGEYPWDLGGDVMTLREIEAWNAWKTELEQSRYHHITSSAI